MNEQPSGEPQKQQQQPPSPLDFFMRASQGQRRRVVALEQIVASCFSAMEEAMAFIAAAAVNNGVGSVEGYLPLANDALTNLRCFAASLVIAPSYGAYNWPNIELTLFANSFVELGIHMKYPPDVNVTVTGKVQPERIRSVGTALFALGNYLRKVAGSAYFFSEDLSETVIECGHSSRRSERVFAELFTSALSARALSANYAPNTVDATAGLKRLLSAWYGQNGISNNV